MGANPAPMISITTKFCVTEYGAPVVALKTYVMGPHSETDSEYIQTQIIAHIVQAAHTAAG